YSELHRIAETHMSKQPAGQTMQATALVHEAYLRLCMPRTGRARTFRHRAHFLNSAARAMRSVLVDHARQRQRALQAGTAVAVAPAPAKREAYLRVVCEDDLALFNELTALLSQEDGDGFLEPPEPEELTQPLRDLSFDFRGCRLGEFELLEEIGRGATGVVYR